MDLLRYFDSGRIDWCELFRPTLPPQFLRRWHRCRPCPRRCFMTSVVAWTLIRAGFRLRDYAVFLHHEKRRKSLHDYAAFRLRENRRKSLRECTLQRVSAFEITQFSDS